MTELYEDLSAMSEALQKQREQLLEDLKNFKEEAIKSGVLAKVPKDAVKLDVDFSNCPIEPLKTLDAYEYKDKYFLTLKDKDFVIYIGFVDSNDAKKSAESDLMEFPLLTFVGIQLVIGGYDKVAELLSDDNMLITYAQEAFLGMMKAQKNGHISMEELMGGKISAEEAKEVMDYLRGEASETV